MKIHFDVSAKAARLIGRENITDTVGALTELIKNAYDADASCAYVHFVIPFPDVPTFFEPLYASSVLSEIDYARVLSCYHTVGNRLERKDSLSDEEKSNLEEVLFSYNRIIVADNGEGMTLETVQSSWMQIGTSAKETNAQTRKGRVKTGAKGIGRFALDKLSRRSEMYTKAAGGSTIHWQVEWDRFTNARLLSEIEAEIDESDMPVADSLRKYLNQSEFEEIKPLLGDTGTVFILTPLREAWSERVFEKINNNLESINPYGSADQFDVVVKNRTLPQYSFRTERTAIAKENYDYRISAHYRGGDTFKVTIMRNEFLDHTHFAEFSANDKKEIFSLSEFWSRDAFLKAPMREADYCGGSHTLTLNVDDIVRVENLEKIRMVGPFSAELFFIRNRKSGHAVAKDVSARRRNVVLKHFSGVKLYRDNFKVRPYGDTGNDWLELADRANRSPAGVGDTDGTWRVMPYQLIGIVKITRFGNPMLYDMANREGLTQNEYYDIFVRMLQEAVSRFEYDRQYVYREYHKWSDECKKTLQPAIERIKQDVKAEIAHAETGTSGYGRKRHSQSEFHRERFSEREYRNAVGDLLRENEESQKAQQTLEILSSMGIILHTFFHEFQGISTDLHTRGSQMRICIDYLLHGGPFEGESYMNPYEELAAEEYVNRLLDSWLDVVMQAVQKPSFLIQAHSLPEEIHAISRMWQPLLREKGISLNFMTDTQTDDCFIQISMIDLYVIFNNFILNSIWFLERGEQKTREICVRLLEKSEKIRLNLENNGPPLAEKFRDQRMKIFDLGETGKKNGTGLGLWLFRNAVERSDGLIVDVPEMDSGFGITIEWKKESPDP